jgi:peptide/nickel transport system substrate-binding protein
MVHLGVVALLLVILVMSGCTAGGPTTPASGGATTSAGTSLPMKRVITAIQGDPATLSAAINSAGAGRVRGVPEVEMMMHAGMTVLDQSGARRPLIAQDVPAVENGLWQLFPDGRMETSWRIREGARWHDGTPFTAEDLLFTIRVSQDKELDFLGHPAFGLIDRAEATGPRTLTITWKRPFIEADGLFAYDAGLPLPKHLLEPSYVDAKGGFTEVPYWTTGFVGTGAYKLREFVRSSHMILEANDAYILGRPRLDVIEIRFIPDLNVYVANLLSGEVEFALGRSLSLEQVSQLRARWSGGTVAVQPATSWTALFPQHTSPTPAVLAEVGFRRALLHGLDRQQLVDALLDGLVPVAHSMVSPAQPEFSEVQGSIVRYDFDPRRAAQLAEGFGFTRGPDGLLRDTAGQVLTVEARTTGGDDFRDKMLFAIVDDWKRMGVNGEGVIIPRQRANDREYRVTRPAFELVNQPTGLRGLLRFHSGELPTPDNNYRGDNRTRYGSHELDTLIDRFMVTIPRPERMQILNQIVRHMTDRLVVMDVHYQGEVGASAHRVKNVRPGDPINAHEWDVER